MRAVPVLACLAFAAAGAAACKSSEEAPRPQAAPASTPAPAPPPARDAPEPAGAAARKVGADVPEAAVARAHGLLAALRAGLLEALTAALQEGPAKAIDACAVRAPAIARELGTDGATVGRMTRRPRNPANAVTGWQEEALGHFEALVAAGAALDGAVFARVLDDGRIGYAEPLVIGGLCLTCHGEGLAEDTTAALAARYPEDRATGYQVGDLRGLAWAELPR